MSDKFFNQSKFRNKMLQKILSLFLLIILFNAVIMPKPFIIIDKSNNDTSIVQKYGQLSVNGTSIVNQHGDTISLRGMSLFWSQWMGRFYNEGCINWLADNWKCTIVRAAMGIENGGYLQYPQTELNKIKTVIEASINAGIYVIVDWHDHNAQNHLEQSIGFFKQIAQLYGNYPNVIYEVFNEPTQISWTNDVKPYALAVIDSIRKIDPDNIILVGSPTWSQDVDTVSRNPINRTNIAYSLHFYAATHKQALRNKAVTALNNGIALFVSEWGTCEASGTGVLDYAEVDLWINFMESRKISWCNWSLCDKDETSAALKVGASSDGGWADSMLSPSGVLVRNKIIFYNETTSADIGSNYNPDKFYLYQNYPNPFNPTTTIEYDLPVNGNVKIEIYDLLGCKVKTLLKNYEYSGKHKIEWNGKSDTGQKVSSGIYLYNLSFNNRNQFRKAILLN